jgi:hypothetical protein
MRVLVACEQSGIVRRAFSRLGHDAWSCDLVPAEDQSNHHIVCDAREILGWGWDLLMVAHPPCTRLCLSGLRWLYERDLWRELDEACELFSAFWNAPIDRIAIENPKMHRHAKARIVNFQPPAQTIQPWQFGHGETKATSLWLKNLPKIVPTNIVSGRVARIHRMPQSPRRQLERSRTFYGIADAFAAQWGTLNGPIDLLDRTWDCNA